MFWRKISLAPWKYDKTAFDQFFSSISIRDHQLVDETKVHTSNVHLKEFLVPHWKESHALYSNCDGSGTSRFRNEAIFKGVSEAFERLAFYYHFNNVQYGFHIESSTCGVAAFPGLSQTWVREVAYSEAIERWSLRAFWKGELKILKEEHHGHIRNLYFEVPFLGFMFLISYADFPKSEIAESRSFYRAYGFAAGKNKNEVQFRATVELSRNAEVLEGQMSLPDRKLSFIEKQILYFSGVDGILSFDDKVARSRGTRVLKCATPKIIVDRSLRGPWSDFCEVHRVLFEGMSNKVAPDEFYF